MNKRRWCAMVVLSFAGCHFRAGFGPAPTTTTHVDHSVIRDTVPTDDGGKRINETDKTTTTYDDGRSTTVETDNVTIVQPDGHSSKTSTQTKTERSSNGSVSTSSTSSSSQWGRKPSSTG